LFILGFHQTFWVLIIIWAHFENQHPADSYTFNFYFLIVVTGKSIWFIFGIFGYFKLLNIFRTFHKNVSFCVCVGGGSSNILGSAHNLGIFWKPTSLYSYIQFLLPDCGYWKGPMTLLNDFIHSIIITWQQGTDDFLGIGIFVFL